MSGSKKNKIDVDPNELATTLAILALREQGIIL